MRAVAAVALLLWVGLGWADENAAWIAIADGRAVLLIRHASAPGIGDPPGFVLGDCSTQRNLNEAGRLQARRWGELLRHKGIVEPTIFSSRWCRALQTGELMEVGPVKPLPALDSFFADDDREGQQTQALRDFLASMSETRSIVLISHQVNITALTGVFPRSAEALILALPLTGPPEVLAQISLP